MQRLPYILLFGLLTLSGCSSDREAALFRPWGWEGANDARRSLADYKHVLVTRVDECSWEDRGPNRLTPWHYKATVIKAYKGAWRVSERIAFVHYVDAPAPTASTPKRPTGDLVFVFTNEHTNSEIALGTGEWGHYREEMAPALEYLYPTRTK
jgi:hypothetical protein